MQKPYASLIFGAGVLKIQFLVDLFEIFYSLMH
jgi:hypothetical protein